MNLTTRFKDISNRVWNAFLEHFDLVKCSGEIVQIGITCEKIFTPKDWVGNEKLPTIEGQSRIFQSFKPRRAIATEHLYVTYSKQVKTEIPITSRRKKLVFKTETKTAQVAAILDCASDIVLVQSFAGSVNCFPNAPREENGIPCSALSAKSTSNQIDWPVIRSGCDASVKFAVEPSVIYQTTPPDGFTYDDIESIEVKVRLALFGPVIQS